MSLFRLAQGLALVAFLASCSGPIDLANSPASGLARSVAQVISGNGVSVDYHVSCDWGNGYNISITITNQGSQPLRNWSLDWTTTSVPTITGSWSVTLSTAGGRLHAVPLPYASDIGPQGSFNFGYTVSGTSATANLLTLSFNGIALKSATTNSSGGSSSRPVDRYGQLKVVGNRIVDKSGNAVQLRGVSSHGLQWFPFVAHQTVKNLGTLMAPDVIRAAMYVHEWDGAKGVYAGYLGVHPQVKQTLITTVEDAIDQGIYVIVDWHIHWNPPTAQNAYWTGDPYTNDAVSFFKEVGQIVYLGKPLKDYPNVIWEVINEPGSSISWDQVKAHANAVIQQIRNGNADPDNLILVPANNWAQNLDVVAQDGASNRPDRLTSNVAYTLHFYAASHGADIRAKAQSALNAGLAVFADEWGTGDYTGAGVSDYNASQTWINWMADNKVSWASWNVSDKAETSAILVPGSGLAGPWNSTQLTTDGSWIKGWIATGR